MEHLISSICDDHGHVELAPHYYLSNWIRNFELLLRKLVLMNEGKVIEYHLLQL